MSDPNISDHASKGGKARKQALTPEERSAIARHAVESRWAKEANRELPKASHTGPLRIADIEFECAVVKVGDTIHRLVSEAKFMEAMGMYRSGALSTRRKRNEAGAQVPLFLAHKNLKPYAEKHLGGVHFQPLKYVTETGSVAHGIVDEVIPKVCEIWIDADRDGVLGERQKLIAQKADLLIRGFARIGIRALIDEATGFQYERPRRDLEDQLNKFLAESLSRWARTFPSDYFKHLCRLRGVELRPDMRLPSYFGTLTNKLVYRRIAPGLLVKLKERRGERGRPSNKLCWWLNDDVGKRELLIHLGVVVGLMKINTDYDAFERQLDQVAEIYPETPSLFHDPADWEPKG
jgi:hypothetical protein